MKPSIVVITFCLSVSLSALPSILIGLDKTDGQKDEPPAAAWKFVRGEGCRGWPSARILFVELDGNGNGIFYDADIPHCGQLTGLCHRYFTFAFTYTLQWVGHVAQLETSPDTFSLGTIDLQWNDQTRALSLQGIEGTITLPLFDDCGDQEYACSCMNHEDCVNSPRCEAIVEVDPTTWGRIKAKYGN